MRFVPDVKIVIFHLFCYCFNFNFFLSSYFVRTEQRNRRFIQVCDYNQVALRQQLKLGGKSMIVLSLPLSLVARC